MAFLALDPLLGPDAIPPPVIGVLDGLAVRAAAGVLVAAHAGLRALEKGGAEDAAVLAGGSDTTGGGVTDAAGACLGVPGLGVFFGRSVDAPVSHVAGGAGEAGHLEFLEVGRVLAPGGEGPPAAHGFFLLLGEGGVALVAALGAAGVAVPHIDGLAVDARAHGPAVGGGPPLLVLVEVSAAAVGRKKRALAPLVRGGGLTHRGDGGAPVGLGGFARASPLARPGGTGSRGSRRRDSAKCRSKRRHRAMR